MASTRLFELKNDVRNVMFEEGSLNMGIQAVLERKANWRQDE